MPAVVKILIVFAALLAAARLRCPLGVALVFGGLGLNLWAGRGWTVALAELGRAALAAELWLLLAITILIIEIARFMTEPSNADEIVNAIRRWGGRHGRAASLMALPAVIGLVPMPAGALFSAPFVEQAGGADGDPVWKAAINYWFRHVWEYWWPVYPGVIITMALFEMEAWRFIAGQFPFTLAAVGAGFFFLVRPHVHGLSSREGSGDPVGRRAAFLFLPLVMAVTSVLVLPPLMRHAGLAPSVQVRKLLAMLIGLCAALPAILLDGRRRRRAGQTAAGRMFSTLRKPKSVGVLTALAGVLVFKSMLTASGLLPEAGRDIVAAGLPLAVAVAALPFLAGFVTGIALGFAGLAFPLVVGLMTAEGSGLTPLATLSLAFGFGYMGMMLSPVHLCLLVTREYFGASLPAVYRRILPCAAVILVLSLALHGLFTVTGV